MAAAATAYFRQLNARFIRLADATKSDRLWLLTLASEEFFRCTCGTDIKFAHHR
jgi:hypothetical protein